MKIKPIVLAAIIVGALGMAIALAFIFTSGTKDTSDAIQAIPIDAAIVAKINNVEQLANELQNDNTFWNTLNSFNLVSGVNQFFDFAKRQQSAIFEQLVMNNEAYLSVHAVGNGTPECLFVANVPERIKPNDIQNFILQSFGSNYSENHREYNGTRIFTVTHKTKDTDPSYSFAIRNNVTILSQSQLLVESAVGQLSAGISLSSDAGFVKALSTAGTKVNVSILVNHTKLPLAFASLFYPNKRNGINWISKSANWTEVDLSIKKDAFFLNGFTQVPDSVNAFYKIISKQKPVNVTLPQVIPVQTAAYTLLGISNINSYLESYAKFLENQGLGFKYNNNIKQFSNELGTNITELYSTIFGKQLAVVFIPFEGGTYNSCWFTVAEVQSQSLARLELTKAIETYARKNNLSKNSFIHSFRIDREKSVNIYKFPKKGLHSTLFGNLFSVTNDQYFTFIDSYMVFAESFEMLSKLIISNVHNRHLALDEGYRTFSQSLTSETNFTAYINPSKAKILYGSLLSPTAASRILSRMETMEKIQGVAFQLNGGRNLIFNNIVAKYTPYSIDSPQTVWESRLDTSISMKPQLVINHLTQNREIFVQDNLHNIYLINDVGRVLWKRPLDEQIMGEAHQIDVYRNGRLQIMFNTKSKIYLIDRNGNNVSGYPITLRANAANPVAVIDYEKNRDYRFFIAGEDRTVRVYNKQGNMVTGWVFDKTEKTVTQPIQHFRYARKDYIVFSDANKIYIVDRRGNERVKVQEHFSKALHSNISLDATNGPVHFVTTNTLGVIKKISLNGKVTDLKLKPFTDKHFFDCQDVNADGKNDYIILDENKLMVYNANGKQLFEKKFKEPPLPKVTYFHFGARDRKLGVTCTNSSEIHLINGNGEHYKGFPLKGSTPFSIGQFANTKSTFNLIAGSPTGYVLNYAVQ
ncbi:MAG: hypothetical protein RBR13_01910 [Tenuifilaceae bacterium]|nr:hypothetical protein [Tenuifilaceae bacterium]